MGKGPAEAAQIIDREFLVDRPPVLVRDVLLEVIIQQRWYSGADAQDYAEAWLPRFITKINYIYETNRERGSVVRFTFNSSGRDYIQGCCFCEPNDPMEIRNAKAKRAQTQGVFDGIAKVTAVDFEQLSGRLLTLLGVPSPHVSRKSADQGIDFFGRLPLGEMFRPSLLDAGAEKHMSVWLVGQAKHYPETKVSTSEIRELVGSIELARANVFAGSSNPLAELRARVCDPVIYLFVTTGRFTRDSRELLERSGVLSFDGLQISQFLADHGVGLVDGAFSRAKFTQWLHIDRKD